MDAMSLVQLNVVPLTAPVKVTAVVVAVLHTVWPGVATAFGVGFTMMVKASALPAQPCADGVTVTVAVTVEAPPLVAVKPAMLPLPEAARPMDGVVLTQA
jgi:hypothetical protein